MTENYKAAQAGFGPTTDRADSVQSGEKGDTNGSIARFVRVPRPDYLQRVLKITPNEADIIGDLGINSLKINSEPNSDYIKKAQEATDYLTAELENGLQNDSSFIGLLREYTQRSAYVYLSLRRSTTLSMRRRKRQVMVPPPIASALDTLVSTLEEEPHSPPQSLFNPDKVLDVSDIRNNKSTWPLEECAGEVRDYTQQAVTKRDLDAAIDALYNMELSWFSDGANHSRSMNFFNVVLEKIGRAPISHGVIDFAAGCLNREDFKKYVRFVVETVH